MFLDMLHQEKILLNLCSHLDHLSLITLELLSKDINLILLKNRESIWKQKCSTTNLGSYVSYKYLFGNYLNISKEKFDYMSCNAKLSVRAGTWSQFSTRFQKNIPKQRTSKKSITELKIDYGRRKYLCVVPFEARFSFHFVLHAKSSVLFYIGDASTSENLRITGVQLNAPPGATKNIYLEGHTDQITIISSNGDNVLASSDKNGQILLWDLESHSIIRKVNLQMFWNILANFVGAI